MEACLCGVGGAAHPRELEERLTHAEIMDWLAMYSLRPFGTKRDDLRAALQTYWQVSTSVAEPSPDHTPERYMLQFDDQPEQTEAQSLMSNLRGML